MNTIKAIPLSRIAVALCTVWILSAGVARAQAPSHLWSQRFGDVSFQNGYSVATDPAGNVYIGGTFQGSVNFGGSTLTSLGSNDIFLAKFSPTGAHVWSKRFGDSTIQIGQAVATDPSGNVYLAGIFFGDVNFGGGTLSSTAGGQDVFLVKFDASGAHQWSKQFGDAEAQSAADVATDASGNVFLSGFGLGIMDFGGGGLDLGDDIYLAKFNAAGAHQWSQKFGDKYNQTCTSMAIDAAGSVYITGQNQGSVNFGGSTLVVQGEADAYIAKFDGAGVHQWSKAFGDSGIEIGEGVATDPSGNVYLTGEFGQTINLGGSTLVSAGSDDIYLAKFNTAGVHQWSKGFGDFNVQSGRDVAATSSGVYLLGDFRGSVNFGGGNLTSSGGQDIYLAKFSPSGVYHGSQRYGDSDDQYPKSIATDAAGNALITGYYAGSVNFGGSTLTYLGGVDVFLAKFGPAATAVGDLPRAALTISASPNPFNPSTVVRYVLPERGHASVRIFDARGERVATLVDGEQSAGEHTLTWDGKVANGNRASSGVYFARLLSGRDTKTLRLVLVK